MSGTQPALLGNRPASLSEGAPVEIRRRQRSVDALDRVRRMFHPDRSQHTPTRLGTVTLVGAGPGGAELITVRGAAALAAADVVVHDRLADPALLDLAPAHAERIPVGKAKGGGAEQDDINALLVDRATRGSNVVRLKGGDPFVFGRGSEEHDALEAHGIVCTIVPGLSSALAAPALAGIPLTTRGGASSFTVLTGHRVTDAEHDWDALAQSSSTLVVLMGASTASDIAARLISAGRSVTEPVAIVHSAGTDRMRTALVDLGELQRSGCPFGAPSVIVIGDVATKMRPTDGSNTVCGIGIHT